MTEARRWAVAIGATTAAAAVLRIVALGSPLWYDEIVTLVVSARLPLGRIVTEFADLNVHPLYSVFAHLSLSAFGESAWALRLPACLFGVASVVFVYVLGARLMSRAEAWSAAALLALSYHHIWFSQNARGYTLLGLLTLISTDALLRARTTGSRRDYAIYAIAAAAGIYTHLTMAFVVAAHAVVILGGRLAGWRSVAAWAPGPFLASCAAIAVISALAYAPYVSSVLAVVAAKAPQQPAVGSAGWAVTELVRSFFSGAGAFATIAAVIALAVGGVSMLRRDAAAVALLVAPAFVTAAAVVAAGLPLRPRFFFLLSGAAAIFAARGLGAMTEGKGQKAEGKGQRAEGKGQRTMAIVAATLGLAALSVPSLVRNYTVPKQDFDGAVRFLEAAEARGARIAVAGPACDPFDLFGRYYGKSWGCVETVEAWRAAGRGPQPALVVHTLGDSIADPELRAALRSCRVVQRFPATLGGGDLIVCEGGT